MKTPDRLPVFASNVHLSSLGKVTVAKCLRCGGFIAASESLNMIKLAERQHRCEDDSTASPRPMQPRN